MCFLDFEYAGWDDPAKTVCDFFCQVEVPPPGSSWPVFSAAAAKLAADSGREPRRFAALLPLYQVKWSCILLNEFTAVERREFAALTAIDLERQLDKAQRMIQRDHP